MRLYYAGFKNTSPNMQAFTPRVVQAMTHGLHPVNTYPDMQTFTPRVAQAITRRVDPVNTSQSHVQTSRCEEDIRP
ncbi:MAG: hypothetical protein IJR63_11475 [Synergistaceae bacterium]|nr:hypothetical protein [Synergistaceae bacterium]